MPFLPHDEQRLAAAIDLARAAVGLASPNPTVGCVIAQGETVLGQGVHLYDERDHAEITAMKQAAALHHDIRNATAYVTLEPCSHYGRTGPCADALIAAGIARCVIATVDPNPLVSGSGLAKLRAEHVETAVLEPAHPLALSARGLNDAFAASIQWKRPLVTLKAALSVDGMLAPPASARTAAAPHWVTGAAARASVQPLRHEADAILTGIGTVLADNPSLTDRTGLPRRRPLLRVVLDSQLRTPTGSRLVSSAKGDVLIVASGSAPETNEAALRARGVEVVRIATGGDRVDLRSVFAGLASRNILSVLVEAGAEVNGALLRADLVDKLVLYYAEQEFGAGGVPFATGCDSPYVVQQKLTRTSREAFPSDTGSADASEDVRISGYLHDPWSGVDGLAWPEAVT